ncbi:MAG TPA: protein tyrosine phosphatase [Firmicutes bacterium]|jgi:protein tyrosine/serine phosphatase|nr:MAG: hypothetical protein AA931_04705 [Peptococcaceae bacterium 1109]HHT73054.1 protein tyrosine phosphatase [Bacillota bacterium]
MQRFVKAVCLALLVALAASLVGTGAEARQITGTVVTVDKYGNLTLDLKTQALLDAGFEFGDLVSVQVGENSLIAPFVTAYSDVDVGSELVRGPGGDGEANVMVAVNMGNFAATYGAEAGSAVILALAEKGTYLGEWLIRQLVRSNNREDYSSDEVFANFRNVAVGRMGTGIYYRSSSPINDELGRAYYADSLTKAAGVKTVINLADSQSELEEYLAAEGFNSPYYKALYEQGKVVLLNMGVDFRSQDFQAKLKQGLEFLMANEGPYLIHCNEGKDRAGFVSALLEALVGATVQEIKDDYMVTFMNYYGVEFGSEQYEKIAESNVLESLRYVAGLPKGADLEGVDLEKAAESYLLGIGLTAEQVQTLKSKLTTDAVAADAA